MRFRQWIWMGLCGVVLAACSKDDDSPAGEARPVEMKLALSAVTALPDESGMSEKYVFRYVLEIHSGGRFIRQQQCTGKSFPNPDTVTLALEPGDYTVLAWGDYVLAGDTSDLYYHTDNLQAVRFRGVYEGSRKERDVFAGSLDLQVRADDFSVPVQTLALERPVAKFKIVATDVADYLKKAGRSGYVALEDLQVRFTYQGYFPYGFNAKSGLPNNTRTGVSFVAPLTDITSTSVVLGFDYVFVNGMESSVSVAVDFLDREGHPLGSAGKIHVPYRRGELTVISGRFLSGGFEPGITIDPDYEDDFNIVL